MTEADESQAEDLVLVPREPTEAMLIAGRNAECANAGGAELAVYRAMISAVPSIEGGESSSSQTSPSSEVFAPLPCRPEGQSPLDLAEPYVARAIHYPGEDVLEYVSRDVPTVTQPVHGGVDILLDMGSREPIGWRIYGWSKVAPANPTQSPFVWRDISSAPRDGTTILAAHARNGAMFTVSWDEDAAGWIDGSTDHFDEPVTYLPSHWQPLPLPPAPSTEGPPLILSGDEGPSCADSSGSQPQEAVKSDGPRGLGGGEL